MSVCFHGLTFQLASSDFCVVDKALKETLDQVLLSGYFDQIPSHQNGVCEEEEDEEPAAVAAAAAAAAAVAAAESSEAEEQTVDPGPDHSLQSCCMKLFCLFFLVLQF